MIYLPISLFYQGPKMIPGSTRTFWYKRFATNKEKRKVQTNAYISKNSSLQLTGRFVKKTDISYLTYNIEYLTYNMTYV